MLNDARADMRRAAQERAYDGALPLQSSERWKVQRIASSGEIPLCSMATVAQMGAASGSDTWQLSKVPFWSAGTHGLAVFDTGAGHSIINKNFLDKAGIKWNAVRHEHDVTMPTGDKRPILGRASINILISLLVDVADIGMVHWDRQVTLSDLHVVDLGDSPRDLYLAFREWSYQPGAETVSPLGAIAQMISRGTKVLSEPRLSETSVIMLLEKTTAPMAVTATAEPGPALTPTPPHTPLLPNSMVYDVTPLSPPDAPMAPDEALNDRIRARILETSQCPALNNKLADALLPLAKVFTDINPAECSITVEFQLVAQPRPYSYRVPANKKAGLEEYARQIEDLVNKGFAERVPYGTMCFGGTLMQPKAGGKWRLCANPKNLNEATARYKPDGPGVMPDNMLHEAMSLARRKYAFKLDLTSAFMTMLLGPRARELSTFAVPSGPPLRYTNAFFGWHSFPLIFQSSMLTRVLLPTLAKFGDDLSGVCWVDDLVLAADDDKILIAALEEVVKRLIAIGARLNLEKCQFLTRRLDHCGVELDLERGEWRLCPERVKDLIDMASPTDTATLDHSVGVLRYYFFAIPTDLHDTQRGHIAKLMELKQRRDIKAAWTTEHEAALRGALRTILAADWVLAYDRSRPVYVSTDASGSHGWGVTAWQPDLKTGELRHISYHSKGWKGKQATWIAQAKECYAQRNAVIKIMPRCFPWAELILLCDNRNLAADTTSDDPRVRRWREDIEAAGVQTKFWLKGDQNTISDYSSRVAVADPTAILTPEEELEHAIFALTIEPARRRGPVRATTAAQRARIIAEERAATTAAAGVAPPSIAATTTSTSLTAAELPGAADLVSGAAGPDETLAAVPGHLHCAPMVAKIILAQEEASPEEKRSWTSPHHTKVSLAGHTLTLFKGMILVPRDATDIKNILMQLAHDGSAHYQGAARTLYHLQRQARVTWAGVDEAVQAFVKSCYRCAFAKQGDAAAGKQGTLNPTLAPCYGHTVYTDLSGPKPHETGYLLAAVEALSRRVALRYLPSATAAEVTEELEEIFNNWGTRPVIIRSDGGPPFDSAEYKRWCSEQHVQPVIGLAHHPQSQALVETRFRGIASSILATLGCKAPREWYKGKTLSRLEGIINSTYCEPLNASPYFVATGMEPRTTLSASLDYTSDNFGEQAIGIASVTANDIEEIIALHHSRINAAQGRALIASSLAQAITKSRWDNAHTKPTFSAGDTVLLHRAAPTKLLPHFVGPFIVTRVERGGNIVYGKGYIDGATEMGPVHAIRLIHFDASRCTPTDAAEFQLESGSFIVEDVLDHRRMANGSRQFKVSWRGNPIQSWLAERECRTLIKVVQYCIDKGLPAPMAGRSTTSSTAAGGGGA